MSTLYLILIADGLLRYDFRGKEVGVIGGGSSSIQIVPELQKVDGVHLSCFVRSKVWISNRFGDYLMTQMGLDTSQLECRFFSLPLTLDVIQSDSEHSHTRATEQVYF